MFALQRQMDSEGNCMILHSATHDLVLSSAENNAQILFYRHQWDFHWSKTLLLKLTWHMSSDFLYNFWSFFKPVTNSEKLSHICTGLHVQCLLYLSRIWQKLNSAERFKLKFTKIHPVETELLHVDSPHAYIYFKTGLLCIFPFHCVLWKYVVGKFNSKRNIHYPKENC